MFLCLGPDSAKQNGQESSFSASGNEGVDRQDVVPALEQGRRSQTQKRAKREGGPDGLRTSSSRGDRDISKIRTEFTPCSVTES